MKMIKLFFIILLMSFAYLKGKAQVAVVNSQKIIASINEFAKIDTLVAKETSGYAVEYNKRKQVLSKLIATADSLYKLDTKSATTTKYIAEAQIADKDLKAYGDMANKKITDYKQLLTKPYTDRVIAAIKAVAIRGKYMQVLDSTAVNILYLNPMTDVTERVIKELKAK